MRIAHISMRPERFRGPRRGAPSAPRVAKLHPRGEAKPRGRRDEALRGPAWPGVRPGRMKAKVDLGTDWRCNDAAVGRQPTFSREWSPFRHSTDRRVAKCTVVSSSASVTFVSLAMVDHQPSKEASSGTTPSATPARPCPLVPRPIRPAARADVELVIDPRTTHVVTQGPNVPSVSPRPARSLAARPMRSTSSWVHGTPLPAVMGSYRPSLWRASAYSVSVT